MADLSEEKYRIAGRVDLSFKVDGEPVDCSSTLVSVETMCTVGRIATASIVFQDDPETLSETDSEVFGIGKTVEIGIGREGETQSVFKGTITDRALKMGSGGIEAVVTARHDAFRMTLERHFRTHEGMTDADIIRTLAEEHGIQVKTDSTPATHEKVVQYNCTDWDLANLRADAAGLLLFTAPEGIRAVSPDPGGEPVMTLANGFSLNKLQLEISGRDRFKSVKTEAWNYSSGGKDESEAFTGGNDTAQGTETTDALAGKMGNESRTLRLLSGQGKPDAMQQMAAAEAVRTGLSRITGKVSAPGYAGVMPLDMISLEGIGKSFNGKALVTTVIQSYRDSYWETTLGLGMSKIPFHRRFSDISTDPADGAMGATHGLQVAVVVALEGDPEGEERIQVNLMGEDTAPVWARVAAPYAGEGRGLVFLPEIGDEVIVGFMGGNPSEAVVLGSLHSSGAASPTEKSDDNNIKGMVTREGVRLEFDEEKKHVVVETPGGNRITVSDDEGGILLEDGNGNKVTLSSDGILLDSAKDVSVKAKGDVKIEGTNITLSANAQLSAKGNGSAEISSSGNTVVKGSLVQIN